MLYSMYRLSVWARISSPLSASGLLAYQSDVICIDITTLDKIYYDCDVLGLWGIFVYNCSVCFVTNAYFECL